MHLKKSILLLLLNLAVSAIFAQVTGNAFLSDATDHSGIKVKFIASSPTAKTDSTLTNSNGSYSTNLMGGVYLVVFSKTLYTSINYNQGQAVVLTTTSGLQDVTLQRNNYIPVSGLVSGVWSNSNVYLVNGDLEIAASTTLTIEPGTLILFNGSYKLQVAGTLQATGTSSDPIIFKADQSASAQYWKGVIFESGSGTSNIAYWHMEHCAGCIDVYRDDFIISNSNLSNFRVFGIRTSSTTTAIIENNTLSDYLNSFDLGEYTAFGIIIKEKSTAACNVISNFRGTGIELSDSTLALSNTIFGQQPITANYYAAIVASEGSPTIKNNYLHDNWSGILVQSTVDGKIYNPKILKNTITRSSNGGVWGEKTHGVVRNNLFYQNHRSMYCTTYHPDNITYNLFADNNENFTTHNPTFLGTIVANNQNGDPIDSYFNVFAGADMEQEPLYGANSAAIGAGASNANIGLDVTTSCIQVISSLRSNNTKAKTVTVFPNPGTDYIRISAESNVNYRSVDIYSVTGVHCLTTEITDQASGISIAHLPKGYYLVNITTEGGIKRTTSFMKQ